MLWSLTHLQSKILESEVKLAIGSIATNKASGVMEFQLSYSDPKRL